MNDKRQKSDTLLHQLIDTTEHPGEWNLFDPNKVVFLVITLHDCVDPSPEDIYHSLANDNKFKRDFL